MASIIQNIIPNSIDDLVEQWEQNEGEQFRLTLLHKSPKGLYCFLSGNLQEMKPEEKIDMGITIGFPANQKRGYVDIHYDVKFRQKDLGKKYYFTMEEENVIKNNHKYSLMPFKFDRIPPSTIIDKSLKEKILNFITSTGELKMELIEYLGEENFLKVFYNSSFSPYWKNKKKGIQQKRDSLRNTLNSLLHEERSPSVFLKKRECEREDVTKEYLFHFNVKGLRQVIYFLPLFSLLP